MNIDIYHVHTAHSWESDSLRGFVRCQYEYVLLCLLSFCYCANSLSLDKEEYLKGETNIAEERQTRAVFLWESAGKIHMEVLDIARMEKFLEKSDSALERIMLDPTIVQSLPLHTIPIDLPLLVSSRQSFFWCSTINLFIQSVWINPKTVMDFTAARSLGLDDNLVYTYILLYEHIYSSLLHFLLLFVFALPILPVPSFLSSPPLLPFPSLHLCPLFLHLYLSCLTICIRWAEWKVLREPP